jgi:AcrR family transcriptional regulator
MMGMSIPYTEVGRKQQKLRTRAALVEAARALIAKGVTPTVEEAAAEAGISRTTAYRYFRNQRALLVAAYPETEEQSLLPADSPDDVRERVRIVVDRYTRMVVDNEQALRTALRLSLEGQGDDLLLRRGRVIGWLQDALSPLRGALPPREIDRVVYALRASTGIEAFVWLRDVAGLPPKDAVEVMKWSADALVDRVLTNDMH